MKFDSYHPTINLIYFSAAVVFTIWFNHPVFVSISYLSAFAYSVKLNGRRGLIFNLCLVPLIVLYAAWYAFYTHFGVTVLAQNFIGNSITLESAVYGLVIAVTAASVIMWMSCLFAIFSSDKVVYLFGRISPKLSLFLSIILRSVPRIKGMTSKINTAQKGIGRGCGQGNVIRRFINVIRLISMMITWSTENFLMSSESMKSRGYLLKGRTAFSIYRFDNRDRSLVLVIVLCLTMMMMAIMFNQVKILYDPEIVINRITWVSFIFYVAYAVLLLLPMGLQCAGEIRWKRLVEKGENIMAFMPD